MRLEVQHLSKSFPGVKALDGISLCLDPGMVHAFLGENGAGKSTLLNILTGAYTDYEGQLILNGTPIRFNSVRDAQNAGISIIHQELNLIPQLSIVENLFLGREIRNRFGLPDYREMEQQARVVLDRLRLTLHPKTRINQLKVGQQQLVEIARALLTDAALILMDEPTSALSDTEIDTLHHIIRELRAEGKTLVYISHKMDELFRIADRYHVLRDGRHIGSGNLKEQRTDDLIRMMVGREVRIEPRSKTSSSQSVILSVRNLQLWTGNNRQKRILQDLSLDLKKGEILGIFGLMGAGRTELLETLFGLYPDRSTFDLNLNGTSVQVKSPVEAISLGFGLLPEDRKTDGLVLGMNISANIGLSILQDRVLVPKQEEARKARKYIEELRIKTPSEKQLCRNLSGGNQQKVVLAKWLATSPEVLFLDEPTRGVDIRAKDEIYTLIRELADQGMSLILVSSELPELRALADRILVLSEGKITGDFLPAGTSDETLLEAALPPYQTNTTAS